MTLGKWIKLVLPVVLAISVAGCGPTVEEMIEDGDVQGLIQVLDTETTAEGRAEAAAALATLADDDAIEPLVNTMAGDEDPLVRSAAASALGSFADEEVVVPLLYGAEDEESEVRTSAAEAVNDVIDRSDAEAVVTELIAALEEDSDVVRVEAAKLLGLYGDENAILPLLRALNDEADAVRVAAHATVDKLLAQLTSEATVAALRGAITSDDTPVCLCAIGFLGGMEEPEAVLPLLEASAVETSEVRDAAGGALDELLGTLPDRIAARALFDALEDNPPEVRQAADATLRAFLADIEPAAAANVVVSANGDDAWLATALRVDDTQLAAETLRLGMQLDPIDDIWDAVAGAEEGIPVEGTHQYAESDAFHPIVDLSWELDVDAWQPTALRFTELVTVVDEEWEQIEECLYNGPSIFRYRGSWTVRVIAVADGSLVAERTFGGTDPRECEAMEAWSLTALYGDMDTAAAVEWLAGIVNPPGS